MKRNQRVRGETQEPGWVAKGRPHAEGLRSCRAWDLRQASGTEHKGKGAFQQWCHICQLPDKKQRVVSDRITWDRFNKEALCKDVGSFGETAREKSGKSHNRDPLPPQWPVGWHGLLKHPLHTRPPPMPLCPLLCLWLPPVGQTEARKDRSPGAA